MERVSDRNRGSVSEWNAARPDYQPAFHAISVLAVNPNRKIHTALRMIPSSVNVANSASTA